MEYQILIKSLFYIPSHHFSYQRHSISSTHLNYQLKRPMGRKVDLSDPHIKIRIIKALGGIKPLGLNRNFRMVTIYRALKRPNALTLSHIWDFLNTNFKIPDDKLLYGCFDDFAEKFLKEN